MLKQEECALRPLALEDADRLLAWRNQDRIRENMYTDHIIGPEEHRAWMERVLQDVRGRYLIFEWRGQAMGFVSVTDIHLRQQRAMWAFYLGEAQAPRGAGLAMEYLALDFVFSTLGLRKLMCEVFVFNAPVIKLHSRFGFQQEALYKAHALKHGAYVDVVALALFRDTWQENKARLLELCFETGQ